MFLLLEDEFGTINLIVPPHVYERHRLMSAPSRCCSRSGRLEKLPIAGGAINVYVRELRALAAPGEPRRRRRAAARPQRAGRRAEAVPALAGRRSGRRGARRRRDGRLPRRRPGRPELRRRAAAMSAAAVTSAPAFAGRRGLIRPCRRAAQMDKVRLDGRISRSCSLFVLLGLGALFLGDERGPGAAPRAAGDAEPARPPRRDVAFVLAS